MCVCSQSKKEHRCVTQRSLQPAPPSALGAPGKRQHNGICKMVLDREKERTEGNNFWQKSEVSAVSPPLGYTILCYAISQSHTHRVTGLVLGDTTLTHSCLHILVATTRCVGPSRTRQQRFVVPEVKSLLSSHPGNSQAQSSLCNAVCVRQVPVTSARCVCVWWVQAAGNKRCNNIKNIPSTPLGWPGTGRHVSEDEVLKIKTKINPRHVLEHRRLAKEQPAALEERGIRWLLSDKR